MRTLSAWLITGIILAGAALPTFASTNETAYYTLNNGLRIIVHPDHRAPVAVMQIWYGVGASHEYEGVTGISHLLEHLMFKGTPQYPGDSFTQTIFNHGGYSNAFTSSDFTVYFEELETRHLPIAFALEADRMRNLVFTDAELQTEKEIVAEERRLRVEDNPVARMYERFNVVANATSPYRTPIIGWMSDIHNYDYTDVRTWYNMWYAPNNAIIVVVGDVEPNTIHKLVEHYFGTIPASTTLPTKTIPSTQNPTPIPPVGERRITIDIPAALPYLYLGYNVPVALTSHEQWEPYALHLLVGILSGGSSARLNRELIRDQLVAHKLEADYNPFDRLDTLLIIGGVPHATRTISELEFALREQVTRLQTSLVTEEELQRVKNQLMAHDIYERDSITQQALKMGALASVGLEPELLDHYIDNINAVTAEQIQLVAQRYLTAERLTVAVLNPQALTKETP